MRGKSTKSLIKKYGDVGHHDAGDTVICDGTWLLCEGGRREGQDCYTDAPAYLNYVEQQCKQQRRVNTEQNSLKKRAHENTRLNFVNFLLETDQNKLMLYK